MHGEPVALRQELPNLLDADKQVAAQACLGDACGDVQPLACNGSAAGLTRRITNPHTKTRNITAEAAVSASSPHAHLSEQPAASAPLIS